MANKGQKFQKYDLDFKLKVLSEYGKGVSSRYLMDTYGVPIGTIKTWKTIYERYGFLDVAEKGRPVSSKARDYKERYEILKKFQDFLVKKEQKKR